MPKCLSQLEQYIIFKNAKIIAQLLLDLEKQAETGVYFATRRAGYVVPEPFPLLHLPPPRVSLVCFILFCTDTTLED